MRRFVIFLSSMLILGIVLMPDKSKSLGVSAGAPPSSTGAPGEVTCNTTGCHDDGEMNIGTADVHLQIGDGVSDYVPGNEYEILVKISDENVNRFGFQLVALTDMEENAGQFEIIDPDRTQIINNYYELKDRDYVTYTFWGTEALEDGSTEWLVRWKAPETDIGSVNFYLGAVSADDDGTDKGDESYNTSLSLSASTASAIDENLLDNMNVSIAPNPVTDHIRIDLNILHKTDLQIQLFNTAGQLVQNLYQDKVSKGNFNETFELQNGLASGMYFLNIQTSEGHFSQRIVKE